MKTPSTRKQEADTAAAAAAAEETGLELAHMGGALLDLAKEANRVALQGAVVAKVQELLTNLEKQKRYRADADANIALLEQKIAAVRAGAVTFSTYGNVMAFTDPALEKAVVSMSECVNCGYGARNRDR